jgi:hypothetical protein
MMDIERRQRVSNKTRDRLRDAASRKGLQQSEIVARASTKYLRSGGVSLPDRLPTPRSGSDRIVVHGLDDRIPTELYCPLVNWYLDLMDDGSAGAIPDIDPDDLAELHKRPTVRPYGDDDQESNQVAILQNANLELQLAVDKLERKLKEVEGDNADLREALERARAVGA